MSLSPLLQQMEGLADELKLVGEDLATELHFSKFIELLHASSDAVALVDATFTRKSLTHKLLTQFITEEFHLQGVPLGARVCVCLPNIPELGICLASLLATERVVFPLNPAMTSVEMQWEISNTHCEAVIMLASQAADSASAILAAATALRLPIHTVQPSTETTGLFQISLLPASLEVVDFSETDDHTHSSAFPPATRSLPAGRGIVAGARRHTALVLLLYTSGTSGRKKLVPYSLDMLVSGVSCIISSVITYSQCIYTPLALQMCGCSLRL
jgi:long-subunit acyl-CoA synthetase (AMP-forming)